MTDLIYSIAKAALHFKKAIIVAAIVTALIVAGNGVLTSFFNSMDERAGRINTLIEKSSN